MLLTSDEITKILAIASWLLGISTDGKLQNSLSLLLPPRGHVEAVQLLLKRKASLLAKDKDDKTALYWAASENKFQVVEVRRRRRCSC